MISSLKSLDPASKAAHKFAEVFHLSTGGTEHAYFRTIYYTMTYKTLHPIRF
jgi:hypothetical protein